MPVGSAGLSAYHAAWHATDGSGSRLAGLQLADGSVVLEQASRRYGFRGRGAPAGRQGALRIADDRSRQSGLLIKGRS